MNPECVASGHHWMPLQRASTGPYMRYLCARQGCETYGHRAIRQAKVTPYKTPPAWVKRVTNPAPTVRAAGPEDGVRLLSGGIWKKCPPAD